jgi:hypothetical protein
VVDLDEEAAQPGGQACFLQGEHQRICRRRSRTRKYQCVRFPGNHTHPKAASRMNAMKHGMIAEQVIVDGESAKQFKALRRDLFDALDPADAIEAELVEAIVMDRWRLRRHSDAPPVRQSNSQQPSMTYPPPDDKGITIDPVGTRSPALGDVAPHQRICETAPASICRPNGSATVTIPSPAQRRAGVQADETTGSDDGIFQAKSGGIEPAAIDQPASRL